MSGHTPGPWKADLEDLGFTGDMYIYTRSGYRVAAILGEDSYRKHHRANARLIAAAPELLSALSEILQDYAGGAYCASDELIAKAEAAIAKARGQ